MSLNESMLRKYRSCQDCRCLTMTSDGWDDNIGKWWGVPPRCECADIPFPLFLLVEGSTKTGEALVLLASEVGKSTNMKSISLMGSWSDGVAVELDVFASFARGGIEAGWDGLEVLAGFSFEWPGKVGSSKVTKARLPEDSLRSTSFGLESRWGSEGIGRSSMGASEDARTFIFVALSWYIL